MADDNDHAAEMAEIRELLADDLFEEQEDGRLANPPKTLFVSLEEREEGIYAKVERDGGVVVGETPLATASWLDDLLP
jgi:hypothetical protein